MGLLLEVGNKELFAATKLERWKLGTAGIIFAIRKYQLGETTRMKLTPKKSRKMACCLDPAIPEARHPWPTKEHEQTNTFLSKCRWIISPNIAFLLLILHPPPNTAATLKLSSSLSYTMHSHFQAFVQGYPIPSQLLFILQNPTPTSVPLECLPQPPSLSLLGSPEQWYLKCLSEPMSPRDRGSL